MKKILSTVLIISIIFFSCQPDPIDPPPPPDNQPEPGVYVAGQEQAGPNSTSYMAKYWKDGVPVSLTDGSKHAYATDIAVSGSNVYVAGTEHNGSNISVAKYWKNGVPVSLTDGSKNASATGIALSGSDVYVLGVDGGVAKYWKNGTPISLIYIGNSNLPSATGIAVSGSNVYVVGQDPFFRATLWKNGDTSYLSDRNALARCIAISGSDVYVAGEKFDGSRNVAIYWKNGTLPMAAVMLMHLVL